MLYLRIWRANEHIAHLIAGSAKWFFDVFVYWAFDLTGNSVTLSLEPRCGWRWRRKVPDISACRHTSRMKFYSRSGGQCRGPYPNRMHLQFLFQVRNGDMPQISDL